MPFFKTLNRDGSSGFGVNNAFVGKLPINDLPGDWAEVEGDLSINVNAKNSDKGIFLCLDMCEMVQWLGDALFEVEFDANAPFLQRDGYTVAKRVRLVRQLYAGTWTDDTARRFALDCAAHVLDIIPPGQQKDVIMATIATAREFTDAAQNDDAQNESEAACSRAEEASLTLGLASVVAGRAAKSAAEASRGHVTGASAAREAAKFARHAKGELMKEELDWQVTRFQAIVTPPE
ncbi:hypothetical protein KIH39_15775 [Telmatocola sphagniphila]|uniref:Uncharacterized protein n=1 Tax=Telmatocola sphagniphila TaxID=1123043 RepID=A0A8E6EWM6_9BACT|nr:hypothetical protein [Telmatocola sphagniphila]QVL30311.1 hypothetical protein KIH39_15775 [Telmatocola sphagniphila]